MKGENMEPDAFNEEFTVFLERDGRSVQLALHEMTAAEVLASIEWHTDEAMRLQEETAPYVEMTEAAEAGMLDPKIYRRVRPAADDGVRRAAVALEKAAHLLALVALTLPKQWEHLPLRERILRAWRHSRST